MPNRVLTVGEVNLYLKELLSADPIVSDVWVRGEISNYKLHPSGHRYFSLKDETGSLRCVMFKGHGSRLIFQPQNGMGVLARGRVAVYERDGNYQLYVMEIQPDGIGAAQLALEQLKQELTQAGLLAATRKKPLPPLPSIVGVVTSASGAAWQDIQKVSFKRFKGAHLILYPAAVQGQAAPMEIAQSIDLANKHGVADVLIVGRGGGSIEELWAFNSREVAYAIARSQIPVISAVGHETDFTIADLVADVRAATPSAAAELAVPSQEQLLAQLAHYADKLRNLGASYLQYGHDLLERIRQREVLNRPQIWLDDKQQYLDKLQSDLQKKVNEQIAEAASRLEITERSLALLDPLSILRRGYSLTYKTQTGSLLHNTQEINPDEEVTVKLWQGSLSCRVIAKEEVN